MNLESYYLDLAHHLHQTCPVVDCHLDLAGEIYYRYKNGEQEVIRRHYLENWKKAGINLIVSSLYLENDILPDQGLRHALDQISVLLEDMDTLPQELILIRTRQDLQKAIEENRIGIMIYAEGLDFIGWDWRLLRPLYEIGMRGASLTWSRRNLLADGCCKANEEIYIPGGLSIHGIRVLETMEQLGMFVDVSHLNDDGFQDLAAHTTRPFLATHSNARAVHFRYRNMTDEQMDLLAARGGVMGLNACRNLIGPSTGIHIWDNLEPICQHVEYEVNRIGHLHVGYGLDLCNSYNKVLDPVCTPGDCLENHSELPLITAALLQRGIDTEAVSQIIGGNFIRYFMDMLPEQ